MNLVKSMQDDGSKIELYQYVLVLFPPFIMYSLFELTFSENIYFGT
jgi:hypothetical protein